jgi:GNAT superfamily N-acetyltransferase
VPQAQLKVELDAWWDDLLVPDVTLRPATAADVPTLAETMRQGFDSYRSWVPDGWEPPPADSHAPVIGERLARPGTWCRVAEQAGAAAGHVALTPQAEGLPAVEGEGYLWMLFVRAPWWGGGVASCLLARAHEEGRRRGWTSLWLRTPAGQTRARAFYEREGWRRDGAPALEPMLGLELIDYRRALG